MSRAGVYIGTDASELSKFEAWLGEKVGTLSVHTGRAGWWDYDHSVDWAISTYMPLDREITWSIPLISNTGNLAAAAAGAYDAHYALAAQKLAAADPDGPIYVRTGWEFNLSHQTWYAEGQEQNYIEAYRNFVDAYRGVSDRFVFEWNVNNGGTMDPATAYPGDDYVDIIGMDFYYNTKWDNPDPVKAWDYMVNRPYGLQWLENFADAHNKPTAYSEWGLNADAPAYVKLALEWFAAHDVVYQNYWDDDFEDAFKLSENRYVDSSAAFIEYFAQNNTLKHTIFSTVSATLNATSLPNLCLSGTTDMDGTGNAKANIIFGNAKANVLSGLGGDDQLHGGAGKDTLNGGASADVMRGGAGDDLYIVAETGDRVIEAAGQGTDTVRTGISYTLSANVENLEAQAGSSKVFLTGNELKNVISGNSGANTLRGMDGNDTLIGGGGADTLDGGVGADVMRGGTGDDSYVVMDAGDTVVEAAGEGVDTVRTGISFTLSANVENIEALYGGNAWLTGNELKNVMTGNSGANMLRGMAGDDTLIGGGGADTLDGGAGTDVMYGGTGNDVFIVMDSGDIVVEAAGEGVDTVRTGVSYTLSANVENMEALYSGNAWLTGNDLANTITGNAGANVIKGGNGADILTGGAGHDTFVFNTTLGAGNVDAITDFASPGDTIQLAKATFAGLAAGTLAASAFTVGTAAQDASDRIIYDKESGALFYDRDGSGSTYAAVQFATLTNQAVVTNADFVVI